MPKLFKNIIKGTLIRIFQILFTQKDRKSFINILIKNIDVHYFDESVIEGLNYENEYKKIYINSLCKAGDQKTNNIYKILRHLSLYSFIEDVIKIKNSIFE